MQHLPCSAAKHVEDGLASLRTQQAHSGVPSELQRELLQEASLPSELQATANLRGSRLAATEVGGVILAAHPIGEVGELLCLSVLGRTSDNRLQVLSVNCPIPQVTCWQLVYAVSDLRQLLFPEN